MTPFAWQCCNTVSTPRMMYEASASGRGTGESSSLLRLSHITFKRERQHRTEHFATLCGSGSVCMLQYSCNLVAIAVAEVCAPVQVASNAQFLHKMHVNIILKEFNQVHDVGMPCGQTGNSALLCPFHGCSRPLAVSAGGE